MNKKTIFILCLSASLFNLQSTENILKPAEGSPRRLTQEQINSVPLKLPKDMIEGITEYSRHEFPDNLTKQANLLQAINLFHQIESPTSGTAQTIGEYCHITAQEFTECCMFLRIKKEVKKLPEDPKLCFKCKEGSTKVPLKKCGACKMVYYCSEACQRTDWKAHKTWCSLLSQLGKGASGAAAK